MIIKEYYMIRSDGVELERSYSDSGMMLERDGIMYNEAVDPVGTARQYTETDEPIPEIEEATIEDYREKLRELGVEI